MRALSASELLCIWEQALCQHPVERALTVLAFASDKPKDEMAMLTIGQRDAALLDVYESIFGANLDAFAECPQCGERLEYSVSTEDLKVTSRDGEAGMQIEAAIGGKPCRLRPPNSLDLMAASKCKDAASLRRMLAERCIVTFLHGEAPDRRIGLSDAATQEIASRLAEADPQAEVLIGLSCFACGCRWQVLFDIESFLWARMNELAKRLLREVHALARAYGWCEADVLAMTAARRQMYLEMVS